MYCGSRNIAYTTTSEGYSITKGIAGQMLFGAGGSVMGVNGKKKSMYHCSACGKDATIVMDSVIEGHINRAIYENDINSLNRFKREYYNIEWVPPVEVKLNANVSTDLDNRPQEGALAHHADEKADVNLGIDEIKIKAKQFLSESSLPLTVEDIAGRIGVFKNDTQYQNVATAIKQMITDGIIHQEEIGGTFYVRLPKDLEEMKLWQEESAALKYDYTPYLQEVESIVTSHETISEEGVISLLAEKHTELSPLLCKAIVKNSISELLNNRKIEKNDNLISSISSTALIDALSVGFKDEFERLEKLLVSEENGERVVYKEMINDNYRSIVQYVSTAPNGCTTLDILERYDDKQNAYNQLVCGEYYGDLKNDNGLWKYHDAFHERRTQIGKLLAENEEERASISSHLQRLLNLR